MLPLAHGGRNQRQGSLFGSIFQKETPVLAPIPLGENYASRPAPAVACVPLPPPPRRTEIVQLFKQRGQALGVRFHASTGVDGAELQSVEPYGLAWRHRLRWGDTISTVRVMAIGNKEVELTNGEDAAKALRPAYGRIKLSVRRRALSPEDRAAAIVQAHVLGIFCRDTLRMQHECATVIASSWRRWCAIMDARALRLDAVEDCAAAAIQGMWRLRIRRWERRLALEYLQEHARAFVAKLRAGERARKRRCIRAPPQLVDEP